MDAAWYPWEGELLCSDDGVIDGWFSVGIRPGRPFPAALLFEAIALAASGPVQKSIESWTIHLKTDAMDRAQWGKVELHRSDIRGRGFFDSFPSELMGISTLSVEVPWDVGDVAPALHFFLASAGLQIVDRQSVGSAEGEVKVVLSAPWDPTNCGRLVRLAVRAIQAAKGIGEFKISLERGDP